MIYQKKLQNNFAQVSNLLGMDSSLNNFEVRLLLHLATIPPKARFSVYKFTDSKTFGHRQKYYNAEASLIEKGYLSKSANNDYTIHWDTIEQAFERFKNTVLKASPNSEGSGNQLQEASPNSEAHLTKQGCPSHQTVKEASPNSETYITLNTHNTGNTECKTEKDISPFGEGLNFSSSDEFLKMLPDKFKQHILSIDDKKTYIYEFIKNNKISIDESYYLTQIKIEKWIGRLTDSSINKPQSKESIKETSTDSIIKENNNTSPNSISFDSVQSKKNGEHGSPSINRVVLSAPIGATTSAPPVDERLMEKVGVVVSDLIEREYIKAGRHISTTDLLKGLPPDSTEKEIRKHIYNYYQSQSQYFYSQGL